GALTQNPLAIDEGHIRSPGRGFLSEPTLALIGPKEKGGSAKDPPKSASSRMRRGGDRLAFASLKSGGRRRLRMMRTRTPPPGSRPLKIIRFRRERLRFGTAKSRGRLPQRSSSGAAAGPRSPFHDPSTAPRTSAVRRPWPGDHASARPPRTARGANSVDPHRVAGADPPALSAVVGRNPGTSGRPRDCARGKGG